MQKLAFASFNSKLEKEGDMRISVCTIKATALLMAVFCVVWGCSSGETVSTDTTLIRKKIVFGKIEAKQIQSQLLHAHDNSTATGIEPYVFKNEDGSLFDTVSSFFLYNFPHAPQYDLAASALMNRSSGAIYESVSVRRQGLNCVSTSLDPGHVGSGAMSSDTTFTTAHHVPFATASASHFKCNPSFERGLSVVFGPNSRVDSFNNVPTALGYTPDDRGGPGEYNPSLSGYLRDHWSMQDPWTASAAEQKLMRSPFLPHRLFSLGLDRWGKNTINRELTRDEVSLWSFKVMDPLSSADQDFLDVNGLQELTHHVKPTMNSTLEGPDIAFLKACSKSDFQDPILTSEPDDRLYIDSGTFEMSRPAVFFDSLRYTTANDIEFAKADRVPFFSLNSNHWPFPTDNIDDNVVPLIHGPFGVFNVFNTGIDYGWCFDDEEGNLNSIVNFNAEYSSGVAETIQDIRSGDSGGALLVRQGASDANLSEADPDDVLYGLNGLRALGVANRTVESEDDPSLPANLTGWESVETTAGRFAYDDESVQKTLYALIDSTTQAYANHDAPGSSTTGFDPKPILAPPSGLPPCNDFDPMDETKCINFGLPPLLGNPRSPTVPILPFATEVVDADPTVDREISNSNIGLHFNCFVRNSEGDATMPRYGIGFLGSAVQYDRSTGRITGPGVLDDSSSDNNSSSGTAVGSLRIVCAPWSFNPYTDNWRHIMYAGRTMPRNPDDNTNSWDDTTNDSILTPPSIDRWMGSLKYALSNIYERRQEHINLDSPFFAEESECTQNQREYQTDYIRPVSMKLCPPNYALSHIKNLWNEDGFLVGIASIGCTGVSEDARYGFLWFDLSPLNAGNKTADQQVSLASGQKHLTFGNAGSIDSQREVGGYCLAGQPYTMTQAIGSPYITQPNSPTFEMSGGLLQTTPIVQEDIIGCNPGEVVAGFGWTNHDANGLGPINNLWVSCAKPNTGGFPGFSP